MRIRHVLLVAFVTALISSCGGASDPSSTVASTPPDAEGTATTTDGNVTTKSDGDCLTTVTPIPGPGRPEVGEIETVITDRAQVDCVDAFPGNAIAQGSVVVTDLQGDARFSYLDSWVCEVAGGSEVVVGASPENTLDIRAGRPACNSQVATSGTVGSLPFVTTPGTAFVVDATSEPPIVSVLTGFVTLDPGSGSCVVIGPLQSSPGIVSADLEGIQAQHPRAFSDVFGGYEPPSASGELVPDLADRIGTGSLAMFVNDRLLQPSDASEATAILQDFAQVADNSVVSDLIAGGGIVAPELNAQPDTNPTTTLTPDDARTITTLAAPGNLLDGPTDSVTILVSPTGDDWSLVFSSDDNATGEAVESAVIEEIASGAFTQRYLDTFGVQPNYDEILPGLPGGLRLCG